VTMSMLATTLLTLSAVHGQPARSAEARRIATDALQLDQRLSPTTQHRLAHAVLTAQAQTSGSFATSDHDLLTLAEVSLSERPHSPRAALTKAVALNLLARYTESLPMLRALAKRLPESGEVGYHLTFAEIGAGDPQLGLAAIERVRDRLPPHSAGLPTALALYHCNRTDDLRRYLADLAETPAYRRGPSMHQLLQMQASLALLTDLANDAVAFMLDDLEWMRQRPSELERRTLDLADTGEVMIRIGRAADLRVPLEALSDIPELPPTVAQVLVFLGGMLEVAESGRRSEQAESHLRKAGQVFWASVLKAAAHQRRGELMDELKERVLQYQSTANPLTRAALARVLKAAGSEEQAVAAIDELEQQLLPFRLRQPRNHPLMAPSSALAYLAVEMLSQDN